MGYILKNIFLIMFSFSFYNSQINKLQQMVKELKKEYKKEKQDLIADYTSQIETLQLTLSDRVNEVKLMQSELKLVKEFRRKRALMQKEIDDVSELV